MRVAVILPGVIKEPVGGVKIVFEYARRLTSFGYQFDFIYPVNLPFIPKTWQTRLKDPFKPLVYNYFTSFWNWFDFGKAADRTTHNVKADLSGGDLKPYDLIITTAVETAFLVNGLETEKPVLYFIQHFENWNVSDEAVIRSYKFRNFHNIVVSRWLKEILERHNAGVFLYLANAVEHEVFNISVPPGNRHPRSICMMYHISEWKGSREGIQALKLLKQRFPDITATLFSVFSPPEELEEWMHFIHKPSQSELVSIYNDHAIFISPSQREGFGLPPAEAMACGCCVVTANSGGVLDFCLPGKTARVLDSNDPYMFADAVTDLFVNNQRRTELASAGNEYIKRFRWDENVERLHDSIKQL